MKIMYTIIISTELATSYFNAVSFLSFQFIQIFFFRFYSSLVWKDVAQILLKKIFGPCAMTSNEFQCPIVCVSFCLVVCWLWQEYVWMDYSTHSFERCYTLTILLYMPFGNHWTLQIKRNFLLRLSVFLFIYLCALVSQNNNRLVWCVLLAFKSCRHWQYSLMADDLRYQSVPYKYLRYRLIPE